MKVVIIGAWFAGLTVAQKLAANKGFEITIIDKNPYQLFSPLLYKLQLVVCQKMTLPIPSEQPFLE